MSYTVFTLAEHPELEAEMPRLHSASWPAFVMDDPAVLQYWGSLFSIFAKYQYVLCNEQDEAVAAGHTIPLLWDGTVAGLTAGWDAALIQGFHDREQQREVNALCGLSIVTAPEVKSKGLSTTMVLAMKDIALRENLSALILPLRPSQKHRYPLIPMENYMHWKRPDGAPFDPWLRVHLRLGAKILAIAPRSMVTDGTVAQWEEWTGQSMPGSGEYIVEGALCPVQIDHIRDIGRYEEPNIWISHTL
ncbi:GNAT family N-acetyltransferase [Ktedonosporobacter rubrisoli]|uniref:GNAT family N-acetyltransferase n=1 Tax=Ktedonosporobacter rubrisoli TaxID=2509675 RepID=A0A4P6K3S7_KTERU|nr:GNAT family N-acetyltransferase [Ktedonosporobacter rubrisoli]QBD82927.1 GNAT family N-acetyltransferase [Ktedonosporobacter rubrisoli]